MSGSWERLEEELLCPICLSVFTEPVQLPCSHSFCRACISSWVAGRAAVRCPECNRGYERAPPLQANVNLARFVERFNALSAERAAAEEPGPGGQGPPPAPRRVRWRSEGPRGEAEEPGPGGQGPPPGPGGQGPLPAPRRVRRRSEGPRGDAEEPGPGTRPIHERGQKSACSTVCEVERQHVHMQDMLLRQQDRLVGHLKDIDEQLTKLEANKTQMKDTVSELEERVRAQDQRMHRLQEVNQAETMQGLESTHFMYDRNHTQKVQQLIERRQETEKYLDSVQKFIKDSDTISFMKDTKQYHLLMYRSGCHLIGAKPRLGLDGLNPDHLLSHLPTEEKNLQIVLENPLTEAPSLESAQSRFSSAVPQMGTRSGLQRRTYSVAFSGSSTEESFPSLKRFLPDQSHHSGTNYPPTSPVEVPPNKPCTTRREPMCKLITCCCSRAPAAHARPLYPASASFPSVTSLEFPAHAPWPASQPLQHFPVREQTEASQTTRRPRLLPAFKLFSTEKSRSK
ncbi:E3 ubiquitin-protein ligase TRIM8-like isoform X2 [Scophthalmus maximus]|uniref:E3 ubiquitin-protein ligase TRIM8-like isoform X2 n=1 Tax=Scophthalmus maximus TaxID=52904 RepID=UPI001FA91AA4|nr:E3 ubiquitin-protein ligase TRIM8-like isoform X2 [Scophthalmus maximus]